MAVLSGGTTAADAATRYEGQKLCKNILPRWVSAPTGA